MGLGSWIAKKWAKRVAKDAYRQAFPGGVMNESLKRSLKKVGMEALRTTLAAAGAALLLWIQSPEAITLLQAAAGSVPALAWLVPLIPLVIRFVQQQRKHGKKGTGRGVAVSLVILGLLAAPAWASSRQYSNPAVSVTEVNTAITFEDDAGSFKARGVIVYVPSSSDDEVYVNLRTTTAVADTTNLVAYPGGPALAVNWTDDMGAEGLDGWDGVGLICAGGETATAVVNAFR